MDRLGFTLLMLFRIGLPTRTVLRFGKNVPLSPLASKILVANGLDKRFAPPAPNFCSGIKTRDRNKNPQGQAKNPTDPPSEKTTSGLIFLIKKYA